MKLRFALVIVALLVCAGLAQAATITWTWGDKTTGPDPAGTWTDALNWGGGVLPTTADTAYFTNTAKVPTWTTGGGLVTINSAVTVGAVNINTGDYSEYTFLGTGSLTVANDFFIYDSWYPNFQPTLAIGGKFLTSPNLYDSRMAMTFGSGSGGSAVYTNGDTFTGGIWNYNSWFLDIGGNNTTFGGTLYSAGWAPSAATWGYHGTGNLALTKIGGTGDVFLPNTKFDLEFGGILQFSTAQNFTNVSAITINGGLLRFDASNIFPTYATGFQVPSGTLQIAGDASLGADDSNGITLGGSCTFGDLAGSAANSAGNYVTRLITLSGNGGVFEMAQSLYNADMNIATNITGPGMLIKTGNKALYLRNAGSGTTSDYSGGTEVAAGLMYVESARTLGTGNVSIPFGGTTFSDGSGVNPTALEITSASNIGAGASVYIGRSQYSTGALILGADFNPTFIDPTSDGTVAIYFGSGSFTSTITSIGNCFLAGWYGTSGGGMQSYNGATMPLGTDGTYRLGGIGYTLGAPYYQMLNMGTGQANMISGDHPLLVWEGGAKLWGPNNYTGTTTISQTIQPMSWAICDLEAHFGPADPVSGNISALGAATGALVLQQGCLLVSNDSAQNTHDVAIAKGDTTFQGENDLMLNSSNGTGTNLTELDFTLNSLTRVNCGFLNMFTYGDSATVGIGLPNATTGKYQKLLVTGGVSSVNGMAPPYYVTSMNSNTTDANFMNYDAVNGFSKIINTAMWTLPAAGGGTGTELALATSATALTGDVNVWALKIGQGGSVTGTNTVTIGSGGLIMTNGTAAVNNTANFVFGTVAAPTEAVIYTPDSPGWVVAGETISGNITANGLTKGGPGNLTITGANPGLTGKIVIDQGILYTGTGGVISGIGNASEIVINGGAYGLANGGTCNTTIAVGPVGGWLMGYGGAIRQPIVDDPAFGASGPLSIMGNTSLQAVNTFTGGLIINNVYVRMDQNGASGGTPGSGSLTITGPSGNLVDYVGMGWSLSGRVSLLGASDQSMLTFEYQTGHTGAKTWSFGSLEGTGDIVEGGYTGISNMTLQIGTDNTNSDFFGRIYEDTDTSTGTYANNIASQMNFIKTGTGILTMWGDESWHGTTTISGGTLRINGSLRNGTAVNYTGGITVNSGGTLDGIGLVERNVTVNTGGTIGGYGHINVNGYVIINGGTANLTGSIISSSFNLYSGSATVNGAVINGGFYEGSGTYTGSSTISGDFTLGGGTFSGTHTINTSAAGSPWVGGFPAGLQVAGGVFDGNNTITGSVYTDRDDNWMGYAGTIQGTGTIGGNVYVWTGMYNGTHAIAGNVDVQDYWYFDTGTPTASNFAGQTTIGGNVTLGSNNGSNGAVTFTGGHTIGGSLTVVAGNTQPVTISPHNSVTGNAGTLTVGAGMTLDHGTTLNFNLGQVGTVGGGVNDLIAITGDLSLDGTLNVNALTNFGPGTYTLFTYTGALTEPNGNLTLGTMPGGGYTYSFTSGTLHSGSITTYEINLSVVTPYPPGDTNHDGVTNSLDIDAIYKHFNADPSSQWKVATDGLPVGQQDVTYELHTIFGTSYADANLDKKTDFVDFQVLLDHWQASGPNVGWAQGDFDGSGTVDFLDFQKLLDYWNPGGWHFAAAQAPEPASLTLILLGGLALLRRRRK